MKPSIGRIVTYIVGDHEAKDTLGWWPRGPNGHRDHPAIITAVWSDTCVNLQVLFDANPIEVRTSVVRMPELPEGVALAPENSWWKWPDRTPSVPRPAVLGIDLASAAADLDLVPNEYARYLGNCAFVDGHSQAANPYDESCPQRRFWDDGWMSSKNTRDAA